MKTMLLIAALTLGGATMANADTHVAGGVPLCSRTITDQCMNPSQAPRAAAKHAARRHHHHHRHVAMKAMGGKAMHGKVMHKG